MQEQNITRAILVARAKLTPSAKTGIQMASNLECFLEAELMISITEHDLVPEHVVMTSEEKKELLVR